MTAVIEEHGYRGCLGKRKRRGRVNKQKRGDLEKQNEEEGRKTKRRNTSRVLGAAVGGNSSEKRKSA